MIGENFDYSTIMIKQTILGIETSGILCSVAWWQNELLLLEDNLERKNEHGVILAASVQRGFQELKLEPKEVTHVVVGSGPGSFTGLRIGMSYAKGFCYGHNIPLVPVSNFEVLADCVEEDIFPIYTLIEAGKGNYYTGIFDQDKSILDETKACSVSQLIDIVSDTGIIVIHEENTIGYFTQYFEKSIKIIDNQYSAAKLCELGYKKIQRGLAIELNKIEPMYLQAFAGVK